MSPHLNRRAFARGACATGAFAALRIPFQENARAQEKPWRREDHYATGKTAAVTSTSREASEAALWALDAGGNAADAYTVAALTQTVVEPGLTSIGGAFGVTVFDAASGKTRGAVGRLGPAADEPYDFDRTSPITQTGRAMPVPGFLAGVHLAHETFGKLPWEKLFEPAIRYANEGFAVPSLIIRGAKRKGARLPEGKALWMKEGRFLEPGETLVQPDLGRVLEAAAAEGPEAFYQGAFARNYVKRSRADGGKLSLEDLSGWRGLASVKDGEPEGDYRGRQIWAPRSGLITYGLHLSEALGLRASGPPAKSPETVFRQVRIMEEVFLSGPKYSVETHEQFASPEYARERADFVLNSPLRPVTLDAIFNTCFLVVRDRDGNCAWGTHSINTPTAFGAGILVDGVYAAHAISREHVRGSGATAGGISTSYALFREGKPRVIVGSPGFGFVHGPYQWGTGLAEWELAPIDAMNLPRFGLPDQQGKPLFESHYDDSVFAMLEERGIPYRKGRPSPATGLVGALVIDDDEDGDKTLQVVQDGRRPGFARAI